MQSNSVNETPRTGGIVYCLVAQYGELA